MTKNTYDGFEIINLDFLIKKLIQNLTPDIIENIGQINLEKMIHRFPKHCLENIKQNFVRRFQAEKKLTSTFLHKYFCWSKEASTICEIIEHAVSENQFCNLKKVSGNFECLLILRLHGLQNNSSISLVRIENAFRFVEHLIQLDRHTFFHVKKEVGEISLHKNLKFEQIQVYEAPYSGLYYFADNIKMNYRRLICNENE